MGSDLQHHIDTYLHHCFAQHSPPRVSDLSSYLRVSRSQLVTQYGTEHDGDLSDYLKQRQVRRAKLLLRLTNLSLDEVCRYAAFGTTRTFRRLFRKYVGTTPARYRRARHNVHRHIPI